MISGWVLLLVSLVYVGGLFAVAHYGDRRPLYPNRAWLRPLVYSLAIAVYCSSWTFYGAVGSASGSSLSYLPIYVGPILLFLFGHRLFRRLTLAAKQHNITSIADFIASRFGRSHRLAAFVTVIAVIATIPYLALQFKAVAMSIDTLSGRGTANSPVLGDSALYICVLLALFAMLFGTRRIDATEHHHGLMLAIATESVIKLVAFVAIGIYALSIGGFSAAIEPPLQALRNEGLPSGFITQTLLAYVAIFCLPRQFQVGVVECEDPNDVTVARRLFPAYLLIVCALVLPIVAVSAVQGYAADIPPDTYLLWLPLAHGHTILATFAYIGGFSAATGMVIVECVALSTMISNDIVIPAMLRLHVFGLDKRPDLSSVMLKTRRLAIVFLIGMAYLYYRAITKNANLASIGLLSFVALAQFAPAIVSSLYWRGASRVGVASGLMAGFVIWLYTLLFPSLADAGFIGGEWVRTGLFGIGWLKPHALFQLQGWDVITHGAFWSLLANVGCLIFLSLRFRPTGRRPPARRELPRSVFRAHRIGRRMARPHSRRRSAHAGRTHPRRSQRRSRLRRIRRDEYIDGNHRRSRDAAVHRTPARRCDRRGIRAPHADQRVARHRPRFLRSGDAARRNLAGTALQPRTHHRHVREHESGHQRRRCELVHRRVESPLSGFVRLSRKASSTSAGPSTI